MPFTNEEIQVMQERWGDYAKVTATDDDYGVLIEIDETKFNAEFLIDHWMFTTAQSEGRVNCTVRRTQEGDFELVKAAAARYGMTLVATEDPDVFKVQRSDDAQ